MPRSSQHSSAALVQDRLHLSAHRRCSAPTAPRRSRASSSGSSTLTKGTNKVNGKTLDITYVDDKGDAATGVTAAKDLIGQGTKILMGTGSSGVAVQIAPLAAQNQVLYISGPAAADAITGINKYTFRAGRQTIQDVLAAQVVPRQGAGKKVVVFDQDSVFGHGNYAAVKAFFGTVTTSPRSRCR